MADHQMTAEHTKKHWKNRSFLAPAAAFVVLLLIVFSAFYLYVSDALRPTPRLSVRADNTYEETIRVVTDIDYEPFSFVDEDGEYAGLDVELINEVGNRLHVNIDLLLTDWPEANRRFLNGEADIILNMETDLITEESGIIATIPTAEKQYVVYGREKVTSVAELYGRRVASLHQMPQLELGDGIDYIDPYAEIFAALENGTYDFAICPIQVGNSFLEKLNIRGVQPSYAVSHVYGAMALLPENAALRDRINPVLKELEEEGWMEALDRKWVNHRYEHMSLGGIVETYPWLFVSFLAVLLLLVILTVRMISQRRAAAARDAYTRELAAAKRRAEESSRAKTAFLFNMSHDLRTPMNAIIGFTTLARRRRDDPALVQEYLEKIEASSTHLLRLINDVLEMSRIESGKIELEIVPADLLQIMRAVYDMFAGQMEKKGIRFSVDTGAVRDRLVRCDENHFNRILLNLISNAYKFTPAGGEISVTLTQIAPAGDAAAGESAAGEASVEEGENPATEIGSVGGEVFAEEGENLAADKKNPGADGQNTAETRAYGDYELRVKDTGIGMSKEFSEKVFEAFERERTSTVSGIQGTGLGMAITKRLVEMMQGTIEVATEEGKGTEFTVRVRFALQEDGKGDLPDDGRIRGMEKNAAAQGESDDGHIRRAEEDDAAQKGSDGSHTLKKAEDAAAQKAVLKGKRALLVEDNELNREIATMLLTEEGMAVETAVNGKEAVEKTAASAPGYYDLILMDVQMPEMNGYEATRAIRALPDAALASLPIVAMTANAFAEDIQAAKEAGMDGHIAKPIDVEKMMETLAGFFPQA